MADVRYYGARAGVAAAYLVDFGGECCGDEAWLSCVVTRWDDVDASVYLFCIRHLSAWRPGGTEPPRCVCMRAVRDFRAAARLD